MHILKNRTCLNCILKYSLLTIILLISAINFNLLMKPVHFVTGGIPGLSIIMEYVFNIPANYFMYIVYLAMFILSFIVLGKKSLIGVLYATLLYPTFVSLTSNIIKYIIVDYNDFFLLCIFSGIISGICNGFIYKLGFASSGLGVLGPICNKCFHLPIAKTNFLVNAIIVLIGGYFFGIEMVLYAIIFLYLNSFISNKIILGISSNKAILLRSSMLGEINSFLYNKFSIEAIVIKAFGGFTNKEGEMALIIVPTIQYNMIIKEIKSFDCNVFYNVLDGYELVNMNNNFFCKN